MNLTPWFPAGVFPVRVGAYKTKAKLRGFSYWTGKHWSITCVSAKQAYGYRQVVGGQDKEWCGMAQRPNVQGKQETTA